MTKLRCLFDTNVLVAAVIGYGLCFSLLAVAEREVVRHYTSREILEELAEVLARPKIGFAPKRIRSIVRRISAVSHVIETTQTPKVIQSDADDNVILACALSAKARYLVTQDPDFLKLGTYKQVLFVSPEMFRGILAEQGIQLSARDKSS